MDRDSVSMVNNSSTNSFSNKNFVIIVLVGLLVLSFLGINVFTLVGNLLQTIVNIFGPLVSQILSIFGYTAGTVIDKSTDILTTTAKTGIDIAGGTLHSVGGLLKDASKQGVDQNAKQQLDNSINSSNLRIPPQPQPDNTENPIQKPITSNKAGWCLVGEYEGRRGCIEVSDADKCLSGQVFPEQSMCLNPTLSKNM